MSYYIGATGEYIWEELLENTTSNVVISNNINFDATPLTDAIQQTITDNLGTALGELIQTPTQVASSTGVGVISLTALGLLSYYKLNRTSVQDVDSMVYSADYSSILTPGMFDDRVRIRYDNNWFSNAFYYVGGIKKGEILTYRPEQGSNILNLDATNIKLGTINNARLPQNYGLKLGIGTTPVATTDLHIYDATSANLLLETGGAGTASIDFQRGTINDVNVDFRIINDAGRFKLLSQDEVNLYTATTSEIVRFTRTLFTNFKDLYNVGNIGIGTSPLVSTTAQLHIYNSTSPVIRLETTTTGTASIEFQRGTINDANIDYRIINESDLFKIQSQNATNLYTAGTMELMRISPTLTTNYKDFLNNGAFNNLGNVNLSTTAGTSTYKLNVEGDVNIAGIGKKFYVNNTPVVSSQWTTAGTTIEYNGGSVGIGSFASHKLNVGGTINADGLITAQAGITISTGQTLTLSGTAGITAGGLITANGGITTSATGLITANNGITIATGKTLTLSGTAGITAGGLITAQAGLTISTGILTLAGATTMTAGGLITANGGIQASTIKIGGGGLLKMATSTADFTQIGTTDSLLSVATCISLCGYTHPTHPSCILYTTEQTGKHKFFTVSGGFITEKMRIENNGNVGIGTTNPINLLELTKTSYTGALLSVDAGVANASAGVMAKSIGKPLLRLGRGSYSSTIGDYYGIGFGYAPLALSNSCCEIGVVINSITGNESGEIVFSTRQGTTDVPATERMRIGSGGNIGLGTTTPSYKCHIRCGYNDVLSGLHLDANDNGNVNQYSLTIWPYVQGGGQVGWRFRTQSADGGDRTPLQFYHNGDALFNGYLTIGTGASINSDLFITSSRLVLRGYSPTLYLRDIDNRSGMIHMNGNNMYFLNASGNDSETWAQQNNQDWALRINMDDNNAFFGGQITAYLIAVNNTNTDYVCVQLNYGYIGQGATLTLKVAYGSFTAFHRCYTDDVLYNNDTQENIDLFKNNYMGRVVIATGKIKTDFTRTIDKYPEAEPEIDGVSGLPRDKEKIDEWYSGIDKDGISIEDAVPMVALSRKKKDKRVFGVIGLPTRSTNNKDRLIINSIGEGGICVSNTNGNIENGDYLQSSDLLGYGEKQDDDLLHNYTIGKATIDCNFELNSPYYQCHEIENGVRVAFIACSYHCG
jgi:hypothetical protein